MVESYQSYESYESYTCVTAAATLGQAALRLTRHASGRSVVASAPALGAGDREFESPRPDWL